MTGNVILKCQSVPRTTVKRAIEQNKKIEQEKQPPTYKSTTHTMLRRCVLVHTRKHRKTAKYSPRQISRRASKAHFGCATPYSPLLETSYFNSLASRLIDRHPMKRGR
jgi:hypothetical protein